MAKFELSVYDMRTEKVAKTLQRNKIPVNLYIRFQELSESLTKQKITKDADMFAALRDLFVETFPELTSDEYMNCVDVGEVLRMFRDIIAKASQVSAGNSKN